MIHNRLQYARFSGIPCQIIEKNPAMYAGMEKAIYFIKNLAKMSAYRFATRRHSRIFKQKTPDRISSVERFFKY